MAFRYSGESVLEIYRMGFADGYETRHGDDSNAPYHDFTAAEVEDLFKKRDRDLARLRTNDRPVVKDVQGKFFREKAKITKREFVLGGDGSRLVLYCKHLWADGYKGTFARFDLPDIFDVPGQAYNCSACFAEQSEKGLRQRISAHLVDFGKTSDGTWLRTKEGRLQHKLADTALWEGKLRAWVEERGDNVPSETLDQTPKVAL